MMARTEELENVAPEKLPEDHDFGLMTLGSLVDAAVAYILPPGVFLEQTKRIGRKTVMSLVTYKTEFEIKRQEDYHRGTFEGFFEEVASYVQQLKSSQGFND